MRWYRFKSNCCVFRTVSEKCCKPLGKKQWKDVESEAPIANNDALGIIFKINNYLSLAWGTKQLSRADVGDEENRPG